MGLLDLGVDADGTLYAARRGATVIRRYTPDGAMEGTIPAYAPIVQMIVDVRPGVA